MPRISVDQHNRKKSRVKALEDERRPTWSHWRDLADYYLPRRYVWLQSDQENRTRQARNPMILDGTGTQAARTLAGGMMNGITSPARPWMRLRVKGFEDDESAASRRWLDEVARRMLLVMAESNFYNALGVMYLDLAVFATSAMLIYEDFEDVITCYNPALGEFYLMQDSRQRVNGIAREFNYKVHQLVEEFGLENCSDTVKNAYKQGGAQLQQVVAVTHLIEPNVGDDTTVPSRFKYRECYWETKGPLGLLLQETGYNEFPGICPRWEVTGNDTYGTGPGMDALGDVIQLQHETKKKAQGLDKMISPPVVADIQLEHRPTALMPNGVTFVAGLNQSGVGVKAAYQINVPIDAITFDIQDVRQRIREFFHNDLFRMVSQLDTVRSATEIDARREEKLVLLGPVLERFEYEALDPAIARIFGIMNRANLFPEPPAELQGQEIIVQYVSILAIAQSAVAAAPTERFLSVIGQIAAVRPEVMDMPDWDPLIRDYARDIGVANKNVKTKEQVAELSAQREAQLAAQNAAVTGEVLTNSAKTLSETEVGGGANALQRLVGG